MEKLSNNKLLVFFFRIILFTIIVLFYFLFKIISRKEHVTLKIRSPNRLFFQKYEKEKLFSIGGVQIHPDKCLLSHLNFTPHFLLPFCSGSFQNCQGFTCLDVLSNTSQRWVGPSKKVHPLNETDEGLRNLTRNCRLYKSSYPFVLNPPDQNSTHFPLAFNIIAHFSAAQVNLLLVALYRPQNQFCIHLDSKSSQIFQEAVTNMASCFDNIFIASRLVRVQWAGFNRLQADITCMRDHLSSNSSFRYLINTAASAFPLLTQEEMVQVLKIYNGSNDIEGIYKNVIKSRFFYQYIETKNGLKKTKKLNLPPPHNLDIVKGSAYGVFSRGFVEFIIYNKVAKDFLEWSKKTWSPDEFYWSTLHHTYSNPHLQVPGSFSGDPDSKPWLATYANWGTEPCHGKIVRSICVNGAQDLSSLIKKKHFFVNKFNYQQDPTTLTCMLAWIKFKESCHFPLNTSFYENLNFIKKNKKI